MNINLNYGSQMNQFSPMMGGMGFQRPASGMMQQMMRMMQMMMQMMQMMGGMPGGQGGCPCNGTGMSPFQNPNFGNGQPGQFGQFGGGGQQQFGGSGPMGQFLGGGGQQQYGPGGNTGNVGPTGPIPGGPSGRVGNVDINRLCSVLPQNLQNSARQNFPFIVQECQRQGVQNKAQLAYILATATHESNAGKNMVEMASGRAYEGRSSLGNNQSGDGVRFKGRGYVQLTGRRNYTDWSRRLGIDLVSNPSAVQNPQVAAKILVGGMMGGTFTGKGLGSYINGNQTNFNGARRTVNGTDRAGHISGIAQRLMSAL